MKRSGVAALLLMVAAAACDDPAGTGGPGEETLALSVLPIGGVMNQDWFLTNYMDLVEGPDVEDHACGPKSYDGHQGTDLVLPSFAAMDVGVPVLAAGPGTVAWTHDGEYDRHRSWTNAQWNAVGIDHGDGFEAIYGHLMDGSLRVAPGDQVAAGDTLAFVGSSGRSDMPHVHFELLRNGVPVDPFAGPCGPAASQWADPIAYQDDFHLIDAGVTTTVLAGDLVAVKDPPADAATVTAGEVIYNWVHLHNADGSAEWRVRGPGGVQRTFSATLPFYSMSWWWYYTSTEDLAPGDWTFEFRLDGDLVAARSFTVVAAAAPDGGPSPAAGWGGGGLR